MGKHKNRKKGPAQQPQSSYHHFLKEVQLAVSLIEPDSSLAKMDHEFKKRMFRHWMHINNPKAGNEHVTPKELHLIAEKIKRYYRLQKLDLADVKVSVYQLQLLFCYAFTRAKEIEKKTGDKDDEDRLFYNDLQSDLSRAFYGNFLLDNFKIVTQLSSPDHKYYEIEVRLGAIFKDNPSAEIMIEINGIPACKCIADVNGYKRPAFRLGKTLVQTRLEWVSVDVSLLKNFYKGTLSKLDVYIQSHALNRLRERLDHLDQEAINYALWENTNDIKHFEVYKGYLLLPFKVYSVKIGYLAASIIDERLLFRTFLFITHNCTPEGDQLKKLTGLGKEDISYWRIDRLSTYLALDEEKHSVLINFFSQAGLKDLMQLKNKEFTIDSMQLANLDKLNEYIDKIGRDTPWDVPTIL